ncbi:MAG: 2Fe-2S iron-sulfur cluster-binding protein [Phycisphaerales bacterium]
MPTITINGVACSFTPGQMIIQVANAHNVEIPQYCYHDGLSIVASCRICLGECWAPNPKTATLEPYMGGKLLPTCQTAATDGMVVYTDSPKAVQNQKAVMEYLLINHPLDCPVCDQAGECLLQDYSYQYGRGVSRFEETKVKQPKKDVGPHVLLYSDRCIMCSRCVRFTREVTGTSELLVQGRGNKSEIDVFPGKALDNELSANVIDLCPVGALLDKDFLFAQRVWFLKSTPSIDPLTASGDNIWIEHNEGKVYRIKPRTNLAVNRWWITDEVRYGWKFVHSEDRITKPMRRQFGALVECDPRLALAAAVEGLGGTVLGGTTLQRGANGPRTGRETSATKSNRLALVVSPMLSCEDAFLLARAALAIDPAATLAVGPIPRRGQDKLFPPTGPADKQFKVWAEKAPNARGVRRVLEAVASGKPVLAYEAFLASLKSGTFSALIVTGNYPGGAGDAAGTWPDDALLAAVARAHRERPFVVLIDTLSSRLADEADVVLPAATWAEKAGSFESGRGMVQAFEAAIAPPDFAAAEGQIALELMRAASGVNENAANEANESVAIARTRDTRTTSALPGILGQPGSGGESDGSEGGPVSNDLVQVMQTTFYAAAARRQMAELSPLRDFGTISPPNPTPPNAPTMEMVEL